MTTPPITDQTVAAPADPLAGIDPRVRAVIEAALKQQAPNVAAAAPPPTDPMVNAPPAPVEQIAPPSAGNLAPTPAPTPPPQPTVAPPAEQKPGILKGLLTNFLYGGGQAALAHVGLPTDYSKQQDALKLAVQQQGANDTSAYRQAQIGGLQSKANQLDTMNEMVQVPNDKAFGAAAGQSVTRGEFSGILKTIAQNQGKTDTAQINIGAGTIPLSPELAQRTGLPAGTPVSGKFLSSIAKQISAEGSNIIQGDIGNGHTGLIDKTTQQVLQDFGPSQRIIGAGITQNGRAVQAVNPNDPTSTMFVSAPQAIREHMAGTQSADFQAGRSTLKDFTSGADSHKLNAIVTARGHINQGLTAADALNNGNLPILNRLANVYKVNTGESAPVVFNSVKTALTGEIAKAFTGAGATVSEIATISQDINNASTPKQLHDVLTSYGHLLDSKQGALQQQFDNGMRSRPNFPGSSPSTAPAAAPSAAGHPSFFHPLNP